MSTTTAQVGMDIPLIKSQLSQLKELHDAGTLTAQAYSEARNELERRLLDWVLHELPATSPSEVLNNDLEEVDEKVSGSQPSGRTLVVAVLVGLDLDSHALMVD